MLATTVTFYAFRIFVRVATLQRGLSKFCAPITHYVPLPWMCLLLKLDVALHPYHIRDMIALSVAFFNSFRAVLLLSLLVLSKCEPVTEYMSRYCRTQTVTSSMESVYFLKQNSTRHLPLDSRAENLLRPAIGTVIDRLPACIH